MFKRAEMAIFAHIVLKIILPIMILIAVGFIANKRLNLDSRTFAKIFIYIFVHVPPPHRTIISQIFMKSLSNA